MSTLLTTLVLMPFPRPSICKHEAFERGKLAASGRRYQISNRATASLAGLPGAGRGRPSLQAGHLVAVERIALVVLSNVDGSHCATVLWSSEPKAVLLVVGKASGAEEHRWAGRGCSVPHRLLQAQRSGG